MRSRSCTAGSPFSSYEGTCYFFWLPGTSDSEFDIGTLGGWLEEAITFVRREYPNCPEPFVKWQM